MSFPKRKQKKIKLVARPGNTTRYWCREQSHGQNAWLLKKSAVKTGILSASSCHCSYVEVNDEVANLKEEDMIEQAEDLTPETVGGTDKSKTILSVLLENGATPVAVPVNAAAGVKVEVTAAPTTISPDMITAISGGKVTPEVGHHVPTVVTSAPVVTSDGQGLLEAAAASAEIQDEVGGEAS